MYAAAPQHVLLLLALLTTALSQGAERPRVEALSSASPITGALAASDGAHAARALLTLVEAISSSIEARIARNDSAACNLRAAPWVDLQLADLHARNIPPPERTCQSFLTASDAVRTQSLPPAFFRDARSTLRAGTAALAAAARAFVRDSRLAWSEAYPVRGWEILKRGQTCNLETATAFRVNGLWYVRAVVTNRPVDAFQPDWRRLYVEEFLHPQFGHALRSLHPDASAELVNATTLLISRGGKAAISSTPMGDAENPALVEALRLNERAVDQATDAVTPSNIAILALPMVMAFFPVAFIADLTTAPKLLYIVFTDIFSTLPFLIKGIELTATGVVNRGELVAYHLGTPQLGVLEIWAAECHGKHSFRNRGIAFIVIAVAVMTFGILFEYFAWKWMKRKATLGNGPYGPVFVMNRYTVFEKTLDPDDAEEIVTQGTRRWRIRWIGRGRHAKLDDMDDEYD